MPRSLRCIGRRWCTAQRPAARYRHPNIGLIGAVEFDPVLGEPGRRAHTRFVEAFERGQRCGRPATSLRFAAADHREEANRPDDRYFLLRSQSVHEFPCEPSKMPSADARSHPCRSGSRWCLSCDWRANCEPAAFDARELDAAVEVAEEGFSGLGCDAAAEADQTNVLLQGAFGLLCRRIGFSFRRSTARRMRMTLGGLPAGRMSWILPAGFRIS